MKLSELVEQHGLNITVQCGTPGYPPFKVIEKVGDDRFKIQYNGKTYPHLIEDGLPDYELIKEI